MDNNEEETVGEDSSPTRGRRTWAVLAIVIGTALLFLFSATGGNWLGTN